ncbi:MAG: hypothetical protein ACLVJ6_16165 [Merdibacter sp.]
MKGSGSSVRHAVGSSLPAHSNAVCSSMRSRNIGNTASVRRTAPSAGAHAHAGDVDPVVYSHPPRYPYYTWKMNKIWQNPSKMNSKQEDVAFRYINFHFRGPRVYGNRCNIIKSAKMKGITEWGNGWKTG